MGTAEEAAQARDTGKALRSEQMMSKASWMKVSRVPYTMSVALMRIMGPEARAISAKVAPSKTFLS